MKPRIKLTQEQLRIADARRAAGWSWSAIGRELGVNRQIVKREHSDWSENQVPEEFQAVRHEAAAELFEQHLNLLLGMARGLSERLEFLATSHPADVDGNNVFAPVIESDKPLLYAAEAVLSEPRRELRQRRRRWIYEALMTHLSGGGWEEAFEAWADQYRACTDLLQRLKHQALIHLSSYLNNLTRGGEWDSPSGHLLAEEVATAAWTAVKRARENAEDEHGSGLEESREHLTEASTAADLSRKGRQWTMQTATKEVVLPTSVKEEAANMKDAFERGVADLLADPRTLEAAEGLRVLDARLDALLRLLDPLSLRPLLLRTRCDQCPA